MQHSTKTASIPFCFLITTLAFFGLCSSAAAQVECAGSLEQKHFTDNIQQLNREIQDNVNEFRKLELEVKQLPEGSPEAAEKKKRMTQINEAATKQKKQFKELNSPVFPKTNFTVFGAACTDKRWTLRAKEVLVEKPEMLGGHYYIWMDANNREVKVAQQRPQLASIAR